MKRASAALPAGISISSTDALDEIKVLVAACGLPTDDIRHDGVLVVARAGAELCGTAGMHAFGAAALVRSVAVHPAWRGRGIARALREEVLRRASAMRVRAGLRRGRTRLGPS
jgi:amino-acid N-acetyltransferase